MKLNAYKLVENVGVVKMGDMSADGWDIYFIPRDSCAHDHSILETSFAKNGIIWRFCIHCGTQWQAKKTGKDTMIITKFHPK